MKKSILKIALFMLAIVFHSCDNEELYVWDSQTLAYNGTFEYQAYDADETALTSWGDWGYQIQIYNTAADEANEVFMEIHPDYDVKTRLSLDGTASSFKSSKTEYADLPLIEGEGEVSTAVPDDAPAATAAGEVHSASIWWRKIRIDDGAITVDGATTSGNNTSDEIKMRITFLSETAVFTSVELPASDWADPAVAEFGWEFTSSAYDADLDETYVVVGYRKTGFAEDAH